MPSWFNIPNWITTVWIYFLRYTWHSCTLLTSNSPSENIDFDYAGTDTFAGSCPITPDSPTAWSSVAVKRS